MTWVMSNPVSVRLYWTLPMVLLSDKFQVLARFGPFGDSANLAQDGCMVCARCAIGLQIILDAPDGTPR